MKHSVAIGTDKCDVIHMGLLTIIMQGAYRLGMVCIYKISSYFSVCEDV